MIDLIDMKAYRYDGESRDNCQEIEIPEDLSAQAQEYREKLMDEVAEVSDALMERYLEGEEISHEETVDALKTGVTEGHLFPVTCGATRATSASTACSTRSWRTCPRRRSTERSRWTARARAGRVEGHGRVRLQDARRPVRRAREPVPRLPGRPSTTRRCTTAAPT